jgi:hypothetical protein
MFNICYFCGDTVSGGKIVVIDDNGKSLKVLQCYMCNANKEIVRILKNKDK